jgi:polyhydroxyalkanoate synthesis regulator phasin
MFELIKQTMLTGIGFAVVTKDKVEQLAKEYIEKGQMTEKEAKEMVDEFLKKSEQARKDFETRLEEMVQKALKKMNIATRDDIAGLEERIKRMEQGETVVDKKAETPR